MAQQRMVRLAIFGLLLLGASPWAGAQPPRRQPTPNDALKSPEVLSDRRVTFRIYAPKASDVSVGGDWIAQGVAQGRDKTGAGRVRQPARARATAMADRTARSAAGSRRHGAFQAA